MQYKITATGVTFPANEIAVHFPNVSLPATLSQSDMDHLGVAQVADPVLTPDQVAAAAAKAAADMEAAIAAGMAALFDATAQSRNYDNRITCALRAGYPGPFHAEGVAFAAWMDAQNAKAYAMLAMVKAGTLALPPSVAAALAMLDPMVWPAA